MTRLAPWVVYTNQASFCQSRAQLSSQTYKQTGTLQPRNRVFAHCGAAWAAALYFYSVWIVPMEAAILFAGFRPSSSQNQFFPGLVRLIKIN